MLTFSFPRSPEDEASLFLGRFTDALSDAGLTGIVVVPYDQHEERKEERRGFTIHRIKYGFFSRGKLAFGQGILPNLRRNRFLVTQVPLLLVQLFRELLRHRNDYDVIHGHWVISAIPAALASWCTKRPFLLTIRGEDIKLLRVSFLRSLLTPFIHRATTITTVSEEFQRELLSHIPSLTSKVQTIPNGIARSTSSPSDIQELRTQLGIPEDVPLLTYIGRVVPLKQPKHLIRALSLSENSPHLVLAGRVEDPYRTELLQYAEELGVRSRVTIPGSLTPKEAGTLLASSTLYLSASTHEGRSNSLLEALAAGIPPCVSSIPGHKELVQQNENGMLFHPDKPQELATAIDTLLNNQEQHQTIAQAARHSVSEITWERCAERHRRVYEEVM
jgi:glycosyltransferase involved in cell wall biosynthesis